ncbi:MAG: DUF72 domain-containing protein, partial [Gammaproteobacteria bacterium]|nr:DUF72 domain-containing protein [Gammaproteobacteria bacterium]
MRAGELRARAAGDEPSTHVGTSGWQYRHWRRVFYPDGLPVSGWLAHYAATFDCVEVNGSFYSVPKPETIGEWCAATPAGFR